MNRLLTILPALALVGCTSTLPLRNSPERECRQFVADAQDAKAFISAACSSGFAPREPALRALCRYAEVLAPSVDEVVNADNCDVGADAIRATDLTVRAVAAWRRTLDRD